VHDVLCVKDYYLHLRVCSNHEPFKWTMAAPQELIIIRDHFSILMVT